MHERSCATGSVEENGRECCLCGAGRKGGEGKRGENKRKGRRTCARVPDVWKDAVLLQHGDALEELHGR